MSVVTLRPLETVTKGPNDQRVYEFDWSDLLDTAEIATSTFTIEGGDGLLAYDNAAIDAGGQKTRARFTGGTTGKVYRVVNTIVTDETPPQTEERSFFIDITRS